MLKDMKIRTRLFLTLMVLGLIPFCFLGILSFTVSRDALSEDLLKKLEQAAVNTDMDLLNDIIDEISKTDVDHADLLTTLA